MITETPPQSAKSVDPDHPQTSTSEQSVPETYRWFERVGWWAPGLLLAISSLLMVMVFLGTPVAEGNRGLTNLTESYGALERVALWQRAMDWIPGVGQEPGDFSLPPGVIAWSARLAIVGMALAQGWAFWLSWRGRHHTLFMWLIPPIVAQALMVLMVPSNADIFFYEMTGDMAANGINPYAQALMEFPSNPLLPYNHWVEMTAVYGPIWTSVNEAIMSTTGADPVLATVVFKVFLGIVAISLAVLVYWLARLLTESAQLATVAAVLVAWQPALILESAGQAHNDPVMLLLSTAAIALVIAGGSRSVRGGVVLMSLSALVKYVTLPLLGLLELTRLADRKQKGGLPRIFLAWFLDVLAFALVAMAAFLPFWNGFSTITEMLAEPGRLYTNPIWFDPYMLIDLVFSRSVANSWADATRSLMQLVSIAIVMVTLAVFAWKCWQMADEPHSQVSDRLPPWTRHLVVCWAIILTTLALLPVNSHPWYWTWPIVPIAVLMAMRGERSGGTTRSAVPIWFWSYLVLTLVMTLAYHTRIVHL